ncbi:1000_t:CDS:2 [Funneliformis mosseae]|uniref:1000_t:CDS:1 n=1 Tax=Funneliformis mosseae TaxID=27381 RepID=A0A9N9BZM9_FUNMO|nr:1000_t:CDS:2 [Funneliformis mosseae]
MMIPEKTDTNGMKNAKHIFNLLILGSCLAAGFVNLKETNNSTDKAKAKPAIATELSDNAKPLIKHAYFSASVAFSILNPLFRVKPPSTYEIPRNPL